jgi:hypothetical protein
MLYIEVAAVPAPTLAAPDIEALELLRPAVAAPETVLPTVVRAPVAATLGLEVP